MNQNQDHTRRDDIEIIIGIVGFLLFVMTPLMIGPEGMLLQDEGALRYALMAVFLSVAVVLIGRNGNWG